MDTLSGLIDIHLTEPNSSEKGCEYRKAVFEPFPDIYFSSNKIHQCLWQLLPEQMPKNTKM